MDLTQGQDFGHWHCHSASVHSLRAPSLWDAHPRQKDWEMGTEEAEDPGNMQEIIQPTICLQETQQTGNMDLIPCAKPWRNLNSFSVQVSAQILAFEEGQMRPGFISCGDF